MFSLSFSLFPNFKLFPGPKCQIFQIPRREEWGWEDKKVYLFLPLLEVDYSYRLKKKTINGIEKCFRPYCHFTVIVFIRATNALINKWINKKKTYYYPPYVSFRRFSRFFFQNGNISRQNRNISKWNENISKRKRNISYCLRNNYRITYGGSHLSRFQMDFKFSKKNCWKMLKSSFRCCNLRSSIFFKKKLQTKTQKIFAKDEKKTFLLLQLTADAVYGG